MMVAHLPLLVATVFGRRGTERPAMVQKDITRSGRLRKRGGLTMKVSS